MLCMTPSRESRLDEDVGEEEEEEEELMQF
jgi:hypothetical protein